MKYAPLLILPLLALTACQKQPKAYLSIVDQEGRYDFITAEGQTLLGYQHAVYPAPEGQNPAYARSGFLHPVNTRAGQRLTQIQPDDHYHHYGIWNPWTHTSFRGREIDFWNLAKKQGAVRFAGLQNKVETAHETEIQIKHEHVVFNEDGSETVALNELQTIALSATDSPQQYLLDLTCEYTCATDDPFRIIEYRYGGLGWRATEVWNGENSSVLTSEGIPREGSDGSLARWVIAQGEVDGANAGLALMSHPSNYNHPEPLRIWPKENHDGQLFVNFAPTKTTDWTLEPGQTYTLRYRMLIFAGDLDASEVENAWQTFAKN
ncbi:hypothetical protein VDG1235_554 [Verrucomicrobiia bacterium DG1235]|nr:hypothetical protein VDG1235_554 [Verrucomicrobiae bacterium DG1235]